MNTLKHDSTQVKSVEDLNNTVILGQYEGECADANITNKNGMDILPEVWENVFNSKEFKQGIELGWYIGFLGHPEDPNCMDFEHACIVMTEGHIDSDGKVYGKFNLIDTPVGRVVKAFIDAGVKFGISVRGAGDVIDNSVDPDTFVFRGFDLVTFPAFPEAIPTFSEIAASSDLDKQKKYKKVCAAVRRNLQYIDSSSSLDILQSQFAAQSDEYKAIESRKNAINSSTESDVNLEKIEAMTHLYLEQVDKVKQLVEKNEALKRLVASTRADYRRKLHSVERITASQLNDVRKQHHKILSSYDAQYTANKDLESRLKSAEDSNLKYKQKIEASSEELRHKGHTISQLQSELSETVTAAENAKREASNRDEDMYRLKAEIRAAQNLLTEYQKAYATLYANAVGVDLGNLSITSSTTVAELQKLVCGTSTANIAVMPTQLDEADIIDLQEDDLVTL